MEKEFLLSDESLNSYQMIVKTDGIDISRFLMNPVMYYNHERERGVIGRWDNVHVREGKLYGTPVFDENHELGKEVARQVKEGFLKAASIGIEVISQQGNTIVKCELKEASICDIPANSNALQLYFNDSAISHTQYMSKAGSYEQVEQSLLARIRKALGLPENADMATIVGAVEDLSGYRPEVPEMALKMACERGLISEMEYKQVYSLIYDNPARVSEYLSRKQKDFDENFEKEFWKFCHSNERRLMKVHNWRKVLMPLARSNFEGFKTMVLSLPELKHITELIRERSLCDDRGRENWTLDDYRKRDPKALSKDPTLYKRLLAEYSNK